MRLRRQRIPAERIRATAVVALVLAVGVVAEAWSGGFDEPRVGLPDLLVGVHLAAVGMGVRAREAVAVGWTIVAAGVTWFAGNFAASPIEWVAWAADHLTLVHRALIFVALFTFPSGYPKGRAERVVVVLAFVGVMVPVTTREAWWTIAWASGTFAAFTAFARHRPGLLRVAMGDVLPVMAVFWCVLVTTATMLLALGDQPAPRVTVLAYEGGIVLTTGLLLNRTVAWRRRSDEVADAVVDIALGPGSGVGEMLAHALQDPAVEVVFAVDHGAEDGGRSWVDELGHPAQRRALTNRSVLPIVIEGELVAEVASTVDLRALPAMRAAVTSATRLAARHARLRADLRHEIDRLAASRRRLLTATDRERADLADELERGAGATLHDVRAALEGVRMGVDDEIDEAVLRAEDRLASLERDLLSLAAGLGPASLVRGGLEEALGQLADSAGVPVTLTLEGPLGEVPAEVASSVYFVCAEGIANATKHALATRVGITVAATGGRTVVRVEDDGCGGATLSAGTGLRHLADRVSALGGSLDLESPAGVGTSLTVELPIGARRS